MTYSVLILRSAEKTLASLPPDIQDRIIAAIRRTKPRMRLRDPRRARYRVNVTTLEAARFNSGMPARTP